MSAPRAALTLFVAVMLSALCIVGVDTVVGRPADPFRSPPYTPTQKAERLDEIQKRVDAGELTAEEGEVLVDDAANGGWLEPTADEQHAFEAASEARDRVLSLVYGILAVVLLLAGAIIARRSREIAGVLLLAGGATAATGVVMVGTWGAAAQLTLAGLLALCALSAGSVAYGERQAAAKV